MKNKFLVNQKQLSSDNNILVGAEVLALAGYTPVEEFDLYLKISGKEYEPVQLDEKVDLTLPGIENFVVKRRNILSFSVDDEVYTTKELELTPIAILQIVGKTNDKYYLKQMLEHMEVNYKNDVDKLIDVIGNLKFITCKREAATVSHNIFISWE